MHFVFIFQLSKTKSIEIKLFQTCLAVKSDKINTHMYVFLKKYT